jgi:hypothetical protein
MNKSMSIEERKEIIAMVEVSYELASTEDAPKQ